MPFDQTPEAQKAKADWLIALRSGEYPQTNGVLFNFDKQAFCCLGVKCEISAPRDTWLGLVSNDYRKGNDGWGEEDDFLDAVQTDLETTTIPDDYRHGLTEIELEMLAALNDGNDCSRYTPEPPHSLFVRSPITNAWVFNETKCKFSFPEIADWIEEHL